MTTRDQVHKWLLYALGLLAVWAAEALVLWRFPVFGVIPVLLPLAAVAVAFWEGARRGAVFGLCVGILADAVYPGVPGGMTLGLCLMGFCVGAASQYGIRQTFLGYLLCAGASMGALELTRVLIFLLTRLGSPEALSWVALKEGLWSLCFTALIYPLFKLIYDKVGGERLGG